MAYENDEIAAWPGSKNYRGGTGGNPRKSKDDEGGEGNPDGPLSYEERQKLPESAFAIPERRAYPIMDESHARNALARVSAHGTEEEKRRVRAAVKRKYPGIEVTES